MFPNTAEIFEYLKTLAAERRTETYAEVAGNFDGSSTRSLGPNELQEIWQTCDANLWPHLNALVVSKGIDRPGPGYTPGGRPVNDDVFELIKQAIFDEDWSDKHL